MPRKTALPNDGSYDSTSPSLEVRFTQSQLSGSRRQLIRAILDNHEETFFLSSREMAKRYKVDAATIVGDERLCRYSSGGRCGHGSGRDPVDPVPEGAARGPVSGCDARMAVRRSGSFGLLLNPTPPFPHGRAVSRPLLGSYGEDLTRFPQWPT